MDVAPDVLSTQLSATDAHTAHTPLPEQNCAATADDAAADNIEAVFLPTRPTPVNARAMTGAPKSGSYTPDEDDGIMAFVCGWCVASKPGKAVCCRGGWHS